MGRGSEKYVDGYSEEQLKQGIKGLEANEIFDIQYKGMQRWHHNYETFEFIIKFDGSKYFQLSMSGEKRIGRDADTYRMIIKKYEALTNAYGKNTPALVMELKMAAGEPAFWVRTAIFEAIESNLAISEFLEKVDEKLADFYVYLRSEAATPYLAEEKE